MALENNKPQPKIGMRRGKTNYEQFKMYDSPQYSKSNGIYMDVTKAQMTGVMVNFDALLYDLRLPDGTSQTDTSFVPQADADITDSVKKVMTVNFTNSKSASIFAPWIKTAKIEDVVDFLGQGTWKDADGTALVVDTVDYKTSKSFAPAV